MADSAHLEKMGRELKCPICLSLFTTAVSLSCNHVFCNLCILKSMKSDSHCPVCKVPYRRREVRFAPHMDNLVSIYKSMEVASGINIFISQTAKKSEEGQNQAHCNGDSKRSEAGGVTCGKRKKQRINKKGSKESEKVNSENSDPMSSMRTSFPSKKRVHVPQDLLSETPMRAANRSGSDKCENKPKSKAHILKESVALDDIEEPTLSPFFWLREDDDSHFVERLDSQPTEIAHIADSPRDIPSFSDIKDSDDGEPSKRADTVEGSIDNKVANAFDSEMFEWTQRACSPELCVTPMRSQDRSHGENDDMQEKKCDETSESVRASDGEREKRNGCADIKKLTSQKSKPKICQKGCSKRNIKGKRLYGKSNGNHDPILKDEIPAAVPSNLSGAAKGSSVEAQVPTDIGSKTPDLLNKIKRRGKRVRVDGGLLEENPTVYVEENIQNQSRTAKGSSVEAQLPTDIGLKTPNLLNKIKRRSKRVRVDKTVADGDLEGEPTVYMEENNQNQVNDNEREELVCLPKEKFQCCSNENVRCSGMDDYSTYKRNSSKSSKRQDEGSASKVVHNEDPLRQNKVNEGDNVLFSPSASGRVDYKANFGFKKAISSAENIKAQIQNIVTSEKIAEVIDPDKDEVITSSNSKTAKKVLPVSKNNVLQRCERVSAQVQCAFCQSSVESEASGAMMHYFNGKPVAANYYEGHNVIHSHKSCTEWAPNVYFDNDNAINLEAELARSRRIRCSCCGIKGAALGCYEKSCRKSFHVTCAKLVSQCRWDTDNFVMLCPIHSSSKLPKEISDCQVKRRKKPISRSIRVPQVQQAEVSQSGTYKSRLFKNSESSKKYVLCCSGLSMEDKSVVSKFVRIAGVVLAKNFGPNVTHVISATDENGACKRTLKFLMGILEGRWILNIDWVKVCIDSSQFVSEEQFEINVDVHGIRDGPRLGRQRLLNKQPKLFDGLQFFFMGDFTPSYKGYLHDLVVAAGGTVLHRKPISGDHSTFLIYNSQPPECGNGKKALHGGKYDDVKALSNTTGAEVAGHFWVLDCIAACRFFFPDRNNL